MSSSLADAEYLRSNPASAMVVEEFYEPLTAVCGENYVYQADPDWPATNFSVLRLDPDYPVLDNALIVKQFIWQELQGGHWNQAACWMGFFRVRYLELKNFSNPDSFSEFIKYFAFGCFVVRPKGEELAQVSKIASMAWCLGISHPLFYADLTVYTDEQFASLCQMLKKEVFTPEQFKLVTVNLESYRELTLSNKEMPKLTRAFRMQRLENMMTVLSERVIVAYVEDYTCVYPCLLNAWYREVVPSSLSYPEPRWSRQNHRNLVYGKFNSRVARTVILMQKFRYAEFPLHRDLLDLVLSHVFSLTVEDLRREMLAKKLRYYEFLELSAEEQVSQAYKVGIPWKESVVQASIGVSKTIFDVLDLQDGLKIPEGRADFYRLTTMSNLRKTASYWFLSFAEASVLLAYVKFQGYDLAALLEEKLVLTKADLVTLRRFHPDLFQQLPF